MFQIVSIVVIAVLTAIDRFTKIIAVNNLKDGETFKFLFGSFQFRYVENTGAAFSSFSNNTLILSVFTVLVIILCLFVLLTRRSKELFPNICLILIVSGGIGNVIDRIASGYVVDFIEPLFMNFAVFNFADCCITVGAFMLIGYEIYSLIREKKKGGDNDGTDK